MREEERQLLAGALILIATALMMLAPPPPRRAARTFSLGFHTVETYGEAPVSPGAVYPSRYTGAGVVVAVVDTGIDYLHPDLRDNVLCMVSFIVREAGTGNPLIWCVGVNGTLEEAYNYDKLVYAQTGTYAWLDENGHGTHVAGIIAGTGAASNGKYRGVAPAAKIVAVKVFDRNGTASDKNVYDALIWLTNRKVDVVNLSFGSTQDDASIRRAIEALVANGKVVVAAAGNSGQFPYTVTYPAAYKQVLAVAAVDAAGRPAPFSSAGGPGMEKPSVAALGVAVVAPIPRYDVTLSSARLPNEPLYGALSGTSMACAAASGLIALWVEAVGRQAVAVDAEAFAARHSAPLNYAGLKTYVAGYGLLLPP